MRIVAVLSVAFVVLVGAVALTAGGSDDDMQVESRIKNTTSHVGPAIEKVDDKTPHDDVWGGDELLGYDFRDYRESNKLRNDTINSQALQRLYDIEDRRGEPDCVLEKISSWDCHTWMQCVGDTAEHFNRFRASYPLVDYVTEGEDCY